MNKEQEAQHLRAMAWGMKPSKKKSALFLQAFNLFWSAEMKDQAFACRLDEIESCIFSGESNKAIASFAWCLAEYESNSAEYAHHTFSLLWNAKNMLNHLSANILIPREKVEEQFEQFRALASKHGYSDSAYLRQKAIFFDLMGEMDSALEYSKKALDAKEDSLSDCHACILSEYGRRLFERGRFDEYLQVTKPLRERKNECLISTLITWSDTGWLYATRGENTKAIELVEQAVTELGKRSEDAFPSLHADYIATMVRVGRLDSALAHFEKHIDPAVEYEDKYEYLRFLWASAYLFSELAEATVVLHVEKPQWVREDNTYVVSTLTKQLNKEALVLAKTINARSGNSYYADKANNYITEKN
jgi:tetratricopeptide (TPR) repeat protein